MPLATRPASAAQIAFISRLTGERSTESLAPVASEIADAHAGRPIARDLIDRLMAIPRSSASPASVSPSGEPVAAPNANNRAGRMLAAGSLEATVTLADGRHVTATIRTRTRSGRGWTNAALGEGRTTVSILGERVGWISRDGDRLALSLRTRREEYAVAIREVIAYAAGQPTDYRVQEASRCGRCFRTLTDPVSIDRGIGPECYGRSTGSQHVATTAEERGQRAHETIERLGADVRLGGEAATYDGGATLTGGRSGVTEADAALFAATALADRPQASAAEREIGPAAVRRARDLIAEALDAYCDDHDRDLAMRVFNQLAAR